MKDEPMNVPDDNPAAIRALLETLHRQQGSGTLPTDDELMGWLEGTLPAERAAVVEASLAMQPELRRALTTARLRHEDAVPAAELAALEALVAAPASAAVVPMEAEAARAPRWALPLAAAAAIALLVPAWSIGSGIAVQRRQLEDRQLREFLNPGLSKGGL